MRIILFCSIFLWSTFADTPAPTPVNLTSPTPESIETQEPLTPAEKKKLLREFEKALRTAEKAQQHQERAALRELSAAQSARAKEWRENEKKARRAFFDQHSSGPDRRAYVQEFVARKKQFDRSLKDETQAARRSWREKKDALRATHKEKLAQFKLQLETNQRPDASLWPSGH